MEVIAAAETWLEGKPSEFFFLVACESLVAVACFLPGRAKHLSAPRYKRDTGYYRIPGTATSRRQAFPLIQIHDTVCGRTGPVLETLKIETLQHSALQGAKFLITEDQVLHSYMPCGISLFLGHIDERGTCYI